MTIFFLIAAILVVATLALLLPVLRRQPTGGLSDSAADRTEINIGVAKTQAADLQQRLDAGEITREVYASEKTRLTAALARDIEKDNDARQENNSGQWMFWPLAAFVPLAAGALYLSIGTPAALDPANRVAAVQPQPQQQAPDMQQIIARIEQQVEVDPDDARAWFMLGRARLTLGEHDKAVVALRRAHEIDNGNIDVSIRLADAIALTQQGSLIGEPLELVESVLQTAPDHPQGLWLYGMALNEAGKNKEAVQAWQKLLPQLANDPVSTREVEQLIANARQDMESTDVETAGKQAPVAGQSTSGTASGKASGVLQVTVNVKPGFAADLPEDTAVFVYAKATEGPPMPLAVTKIKLADLPLTVTLSDDQAMIETMKISAFDNVIVGARISKTGNPIAQTGDLYSESGGVDTTEVDTPVSLTISETVQ